MSAEWARQATASAVYAATIGGASYVVTRLAKSGRFDAVRWRAARSAPAYAVLGHETTRFKAQATCERDAGVLS